MLSLHFLCRQLEAFWTGEISLRGRDACPQKVELLEAQEVLLRADCTLDRVLIPALSPCWRRYRQSGAPWSCWPRWRGGPALSLLWAARY